MGLEDFFTFTEASDSSEEDEEVIYMYLARILYFLLSECFFSLAEQTRSDCSDLIRTQTELPDQTVVVKQAHCCLFDRFDFVSKRCHCFHDLILEDPHLLLELDV